MELSVQILFILNNIATVLFIFIIFLEIKIKLFCKMFLLNKCNLVQYFVK